MENFDDDGKMDDKAPLLKKLDYKPHKYFEVTKPFDIFDVRNTFACFVTMSAKTLHKRCELHDQDQKLERQFKDVLDVSISGSGIRISSLVDIPSGKIKVLRMPTNFEPISFGIYHGNLMRALRMMAIGKEIHRFVFAYQEEKDLLILADGQTKVVTKTDPHLCQKKKKKKLATSLHLN
ncbi:hypothetical protein MKW92_015812 [Papaver armeniacum]|nr:hypothetical protein MKW92_015812 [Papaver armeniacum]